MRIVVAAVIACVTTVGAMTSVAPAFAAEGPIAADVRTPAGGFTVQAPALLSNLTTLAPTQISSYLQANHDVIDRTLTGPQIAGQVVGWWDSLARHEQAVLSGAAGRLLGNLDGIPFDVRSAINTAALTTRIHSVNIELETAKPSALNALRTEQASLESIRDALVAPPGAPKRSLLTFDAAGTMRAAIAIGDVATADDVSVLVPGMFYTVRGQMVDWTATAQTVYDAQRAWLGRLGQSGRSVATVAWLGYRTPDLGTVLKLDDARAGASALEGVLAGVRALRADRQPYLSVLAHSYGSTAALLALQQGDTAVDALAVVGSPGSEVDSVKDLHVTAGNVYVGAAPLDPIAASGFFGVNPDRAGYGARRFDVAGGIDPIDGSMMLPAVGHNSYFAAGTESLRNLALVAIGDGSLATTPSHR